MDSSAARATFSSLVPRVSPVSRPVAAGSHQGAPSPLKPGTRCTPSASASAAIDASPAGEDDVSWASQDRVAPLDRMLPSTARAGAAPICQAIVSHSPEAGSARPGAAAMTDDPVP
jgi:hypothetical protein